MADWESEPLADSDTAAGNVIRVVSASEPLPVSETAAR